MHNLIISDVFGKTKALENMACELPCSTFIIDPYNSEHMNFTNEAQAYAYFMSEVGMNKYCEILIKYILGLSESVKIIGFSVGASAIWKISSQIELGNISSAVCFYGSQIRHEKETCPMFPVTLIFPVSEEHYSVPNLITYLSNRNNVLIHQVNFFHGFMNAKSNNYDHDAYSQLMQALCKYQLSSKGFWQS